MSMLTTIGPQAAAWIVESLAHVLWQGTLLAMIAAVLSIMLKKGSAQSRYSVCCAALLLTALCLPLNLWFLSVATESQNSQAIHGAAQEPAGQRVAPDAVAAEAAKSEETQASVATEQTGQAIVPATRLSNRTLVEQASTWHGVTVWVAVAYLVGVAAMGLRLLMGFYGTQRLRSTARAIADARLEKMLQNLGERLQLKVFPAVAYSARVTTPLVVGVLRPAILLPASILSNLRADEIESLLLHEVAHIRCYDPLVNLVQRLIEMVLFFHPAVWWLSHKISAEREHRCDDLAIAWGCDPCDYAESLVRVSELRAQSVEVGAAALAATGDRPSRLHSRVLRVLGLPLPGPNPGVDRRGLAASITLAVLAVVITVSRADDPPNSARQHSILRVQLEPDPEQQLSILVIQRNTNTPFIGQGTTNDGALNVNAIGTVKTLKPGDYWVHASGSHRYGNEHYLPKTLTLSGDEADPSITLTKGSASVSGRLTGALLDRYDYYVTLHRLQEPELQDGAVTMTNANGEISMTGLAPGEYQVSVEPTILTPEGESKDPAWPAWKDKGPALPSWGLSHHQTATLHEGDNTLDLALPQGSVIGRVTGRLPERAPGERQMIMIEKKLPPEVTWKSHNLGCVRLEDDGRFALDHLPKGEYFAKPMWPGFRSSVFGTPFRIEADGETAEIVLANEQRVGAIRGRVQGVKALSADKAEKRSRFYPAVIYFYKLHDGEYWFSRPAQSAELDFTQLSFDCPEIPEGVYGLLLHVSQQRHRQDPKAEEVVTWLPGVRVDAGQTREITLEVEAGRDVDFVSHVSDRRPLLARWDLTLPSGDVLPMEALGDGHGTGFNYPSTVRTRLPFGEYKIAADFGEMGRQVTRFKIEPGAKLLQVDLYADRPAKTRGKE